MRAPGPEIFAGAACEEAAEAEAAVVQRHRAVGIAFAGGDGIAHARDQDVPHPDVGEHALRRAVRQADIERGERRLARAHAQPHLFLAGPGHLARRAVAVVEGPGADGLRRQVAGGDDTDREILRRHVVLARTVALAEFGNAAGLVDAQVADHVARPSLAVAFGGQPLLGRQNAVAPRGGDMALEVGFVLEQAEAVLRFPFDAEGGRLAGHCRLGFARFGGLRACRQAGRKNAGQDKADQDQGGKNRPEHERGIFRGRSPLA
jgi:hypothetical protein